MRQEQNQLYLFDWRRETSARCSAFHCPLFIYLLDGCECRWIRRPLKSLPASTTWFTLACVVFKWKHWQRSGFNNTTHTSIVVLLLPLVKMSGASDQSGHDEQQPYSLSWVNSCYQQTLLPDAPWHKVSVWVCGLYSCMNERWACGCGIFLVAFYQRVSFFWLDVEGDREKDCVHACEREYVCMCVCVWVRKKEYVCVRMCVCVCVRERERKRWRERLEKYFFYNYVLQFQTCILWV